MTAETPVDKAADHLHNYPDFKRDFAKGFILGEHNGTYYFYDNGINTELKGEYSVSNNISNFFSGPLIRSNGCRYYPSKIVLEAFVKEQTLEALADDGAWEIRADHPFLAETLCLETIRNLEERLPISEGINGWHHLTLRLENLAVQNKGKVVQIEGIDHYLFVVDEDVVLQYATADDVHTFHWKFAELVRGFKVSKKLAIKLIEQQKFSV